MAKKIENVPLAETEHNIQSFAEDLGTLLGHAWNKAEGWLSQRKQIVEQLVGLRENADSLLRRLGHEATEPVVKAKRAYRRTVNTQPEQAAKTVKKATRVMSDEARAAIAAAQRKRWAKWRKEKAA